MRGPSDHDKMEKKPPSNDKNLGGIGRTIPHQLLDRARRARGPKLGPLLVPPQRMQV